MSWWTGWLNEAVITTERGMFDVKWRAPGSFTPGMEPPDVAALLAWLDPDAFAARLLAEIDALPSAAKALSATARATRYDEIAAQILELERVEELLVEATLEVGRRPNANPLAILGLRIVVGALARAA